MPAVFRRTLQIAAGLMLAASLSACHAGNGADAAAEAREPGYVEPPSLDGAHAEGGGVRLTGQAAAGGVVRLTAGGAAYAARADSSGDWVLDVPPVAAPQLFALSAQIGGRAAPADGDLLLAPGGEAAVLRAGAAAVRLTPPEGAGVTSLDIDGAGGALVAGAAAAGTDVALSLDRAAAVEVRADQSGRFTFGLPRLSAGSHRLSVQGADLQQSVAFDAAPAVLAEGERLRSTATPGGLRIDWLTPVGGVQSTLLVRSRSSP